MLFRSPDDRGRPRVSKKAREAAEERVMVDDFKARSGASQGLGTLGDLLRAKKK